ncbi:hydantoinase/oxoprolinase family protein [Chloroflexota bacterium]
MSGDNYIVGIDTGGTFTDVVVLAESGDLYIAKAPTTPADFAAGVMDALAAVADVMGLSCSQLLSQCRMIKHGCTITTNALINRVGSKVGLITTKGFEDTTLIMKAIGRVAGLSEEEIKHQATAVKPVPLVPKRLIKGISERVDFSGEVIMPINLEETREAIRSLVDDEKVDAIAVNLMFGFVNPVHEEQIRQLMYEMYPDSGIFLSLASELIPVVREYARSNTVILNAFLEAPMRGYFDRLRAKLRENGYQGRLMIMQANGGIAPEEDVSAVSTVGSGPCGGIIASKQLSDLFGHSMVITADMGGTSFDGGLITGGFWHYQRSPVVERFHITWPMIDVESIGAGGGTIARVDRETGRLLLGPQSAGAEPGPVCYDLGGSEPTVTDADLVLGFLNPDYFLGGKRKLNRDRAEEAIRQKIAQPLGMDVVQAAAGIYDIINARMADLIRKKVVQTGLMPEEHVVYAFGGASPVHAVAYASELGIKKLLVFPTSAVFSAFGIAGADIVHTYMTSYRYRMPVDPEKINRTLAEIEDRLYGVLQQDGFQKNDVEFRRIFHMRYVRQVNELEVSVPARKYNHEDVQEIMQQFQKRYEEVYGAGSAYPAAGIELISFSVDAVAKTPKPLMVPYEGKGPDPAKALKGMRNVFFPGGVRKFLDTRIYDFDNLEPGNILSGPCIIESATTTIIIPPRIEGRIGSFREVEISL